MKRKGFTLIELVITIMVIGIIAVITFPIVRNVTESSRQKSYNSMVQNIKTSASLYSTEFEDNVRWFVSSTDDNQESDEEWSCLQINKLVEAGFIKEPLINPLDNTEISPNTLIEIRRDKVTHSLNRDNINLETELCNGGYDSTPPIITFSLKYEDGTPYNGEWTDKNIVQTITASDGNGINSLMVFLNGNIIDIPEENITKTDNFWSASLLQSSDISGNFEVEATDYFTRSSSSSYNINVDKTGPSCEIKLTGTKANDDTDWWTSNVTVTLEQKGLSVNGYGLSTSSTVSYPSTTTSLIQAENTTSTMYYGYVRDALGRTNSCQVEVKKDSVTPTAPVLTSYPATFIKGVSSPTAIPPTVATFGISGGTTSCTCNGTICTNMSNVTNGSNNIVCTATGNNGLSNTSSRTISVRNCNRRSYCYTCGGYERDECGNYISCHACPTTTVTTTTVCDCSSWYDCSYGYSCDGCNCVKNKTTTEYYEEEDDCTCHCGADQRCDSRDCSCEAMWGDYTDDDGCYTSVMGTYCCMGSNGSYQCS